MSDAGTEVHSHGVTWAAIRRDPEVRAFIMGAERHLRALGYTEHGFRHAGVVARTAHRVMKGLGRPSRLAELAAIAGYLHDVGNAVTRNGHGATGAVIAGAILERHGMDAGERVAIMGAIGNHEDTEGQAVNEVSAALIISDKTDVRRSRVGGRLPSPADIHDRVNFAVTRQQLSVSEEAAVIALGLTVDTDISPVTEYFETFLLRMLMCRHAAAFLGCRFELEINGTRLL